MKKLILLFAMASLSCLPAFAARPYRSTNRVVVTRKVVTVPKRHPRRVVMKQRVVRRPFHPVRRVVRPLHPVHPIHPVHPVHPRRYVHHVIRR